MENDFLKSAWKGIPAEEKSSQELQDMLKKRGHSLVKKMRLQLLVEGIASGAFLVLYYDFFDGSQKPVSANLFLVAAWLLVVVHNIYGYLYFRSVNKGENLERLLSSRLDKMKIYAGTTSLLRILAAASFLYFFISVISFTTIKYWILAGMIFIFLIQMALFLNLWKRRITRMKDILSGLRSE